MIIRAGKSIGKYFKSQRQSLSRAQFDAESNQSCILHFASCINVDFGGNLPYPTAQYIDLHGVSFINSVEMGYNKNNWSKKPRKIYDFFWDKTMNEATKNFTGGEDEKFYIP